MKTVFNAVGDPFDNVNEASDFAGDFAALDHEHPIEPWYPSVMTVNKGTLISGTVADLAVYGSGVVDVREVAGADPLRVTLDFTGVEATIDNIAFFGRYEGSTSHQVAIEMWDYVASAWQEVGQMSSETTSHWFSFPIINPGPLVSAGACQLRFRHIQNGVATHHLYLDYLAVRHGGAGSGGVTSHGALEGLANDDHPQYVKVADPNYVDLTDGGETSLHSHAGGGGGVAIDQNGTQVEATADTLNIVGGDEVTTNAGEVAIPIPRQWGWWDEEGKRRIATSPQKEGNWNIYGTVLDVGANGTWDDTAAGWPCVVKNPADGLLYMFYNGYGGTGTGYIFGLATSSDGINWTKYANNPIMVADQTYEGGAGLNKYVRIASVIYDEWETDSNKRWKMWYQADANGVGRDDMCYAYAASPTGTWTKVGVVLGGFGLNYGISVTRLGERYVAFVPKLSDGDYYISRSNDGITWTTPVKFITHTAANLEATAVRYGAIFKGVDGYYFFYAAQKASGVTLNICLVYAWNPFQTWYRDPLHDVTAIFAESTNSYMPSIVNHNGQFLMFYGGVTAGARNTVKLAYLKGYDLSGVI